MYVYVCLFAERKAVYTISKAEYGNNKFTKQIYFYLALSRLEGQKCRGLDAERADLSNKRNYLLHKNSRVINI